MGLQPVLGLWSIWRFWPIEGFGPNGGFCLFGELVYLQSSLELLRLKNACMSEPLVYWGGLRFECAPLHSIFGQ